MASRAPSRRTFDSLNHVLHKRFTFAMGKVSRGASSVFDGSVYDRKDKRCILAEFEVSCEKSCSEINNTLKTRVSDEPDQNVAIYLVLAGASIQNSSGCRGLTQGVHFVSIPDGVEDFGESCFSWCNNLSRVTFGEFSSLNKIANEAFRESRLQEVHIPNGVEELCEACFCECARLSRVTFGELSSLKRIGIAAFASCGLTEILIPDSVEEIGDGCFEECPCCDRILSDLNRD